MAYMTSIKNIYGRGPHEHYNIYYEYRDDENEIPSIKRNNKVCYAYKIRGTGTIMCMCDIEILSLW